MKMIPIKDFTLLLVVFVSQTEPMAVGYLPLPCPTGYDHPIVNGSIYTECTKTASQGDWDWKSIFREIVVALIVAALCKAAKSIFLRLMKCIGNFIQNFFQPLLPLQQCHQLPDQTKTSHKHIDLIKVYMTPFGNPDYPSICLNSC